MPTYEYECQRCEHRFELFQGINDKPRQRCPKCRGKVRRLLGTGAGLLFKGSGFYTTDYRSESYKKGAASDKPSGGSSSDSKSSSSEKKGSSKSKDASS